MIEYGGKFLCGSCFAQVEQNAHICPECGQDPNQIPPKEPGLLPAGTILQGKIVIGKPLGHGGFGITYLGYNLLANRKIAVKEYFPEGLAYRAGEASEVAAYTGEKGEMYRSGAERFFSEARTISRFNGNPNIVSVYEFFYENNTAYFTMEYLDGIDLKTYARKRGRPLTTGEAMYIADKVTDALLVVHSMNVLHRDIAPDNIFICNDGSVKLLDFGAARHVFGEQTRSLSIILKEGFAPFEQYRKNGKQGPWTDIYALGATLYYITSGRPPGDALSRLEEDDMSFDSIDARFAPVLKKATAVRAEDRYQNVFELKQALAATQITPEPPLLPSLLGTAAAATPVSGSSAATVGTHAAPPASASHGIAPASGSYDGITASSALGIHGNASSSGTYSPVLNAESAYAQSGTSVQETVVQNTGTQQKPTTHDGQKKKSAVLIVSLAAAFVLLLTVGIVLTVKLLKKPGSLSALVSLPSAVPVSETVDVTAVPTINPTEATTDEPEPAAVSEVILSDTEITIAVGESYMLTAEVVPPDAENTGLKWRSASPKVATVSADGTVTGVAEGVARILAIADGGIENSCMVTVESVVPTEAPTETPEPSATTKPTAAPTSSATQAPATQKVTNMTYLLSTYAFSVTGTYTGEVKNGIPHGEGTFTVTVPSSSSFSYGDYFYSKNWKDGKINGYGVMVRMNGIVYKGTFTKGDITGKGTATYPDGTSDTGQFENGVFIG